MRASEAKLWLDALVEFHGNDEFDREVAAHIVRVLELVEGPGGRELAGDWFREGARGEMARYGIKALKARADERRKALEAQIDLTPRYYEGFPPQEVEGPGSKFKKPTPA